MKGFSCLSYSNKQPRTSIVESPLENHGEWSEESYEKDRDVRCAHERKKEQKIFSLFSLSKDGFTIWDEGRRTFFALLALTRL
jgi:hypothetical protein